jgi:hypothetical protein
MKVESKKLLSLGGGHAGEEDGKQEQEADGGYLHRNTPELSELLTEGIDIRRS